MRLDIAWHAVFVTDALTAIGTSRSGLGRDEAAKRLRELGPNLLVRARRRSPLEMIVQQFENPLALVLLASGLLAFALGSATDGSVVVSLVALNALIGALQELRATYAIEALDALVPEFATALRDGEVVQLPVSTLVPGDVVLLSAGARVPADMRVIYLNNVTVSELALTGESVPTTKQLAPVPEEVPLGDRTNMLYAGTIVSSGAARGVIVATGTATELGRISMMLHAATRPETPLMTSLAQFGKRLTKVICCVAAVLFCVAYFRGFPLFDAVRAGISLACASIPVALPATVTITLAVAVRRMAARNAIVRTLPAIETLGSTDIICTDKTGTLTVGDMTVRRLWTSGLSYELTGIGYSPEGTLRLHEQEVESLPPQLLDLVYAGVLCNDAIVRAQDDEWIGIGSPTEIPLLFAAMKIGLNVERVRARWRRLDVVPFDSKTKRMVTLHEDADRNQVVIIKGAPEVVLQSCSRVDGNPEPELGAVQEIIDLLAASGMRVIAIARDERLVWSEQLATDEPSSAHLLGLVGLMDPPRSEAMAAIATCHGAGIRIKMATGDHPATAKAIGVELGIVEQHDRVVAGPEIDALDDYGFLMVAETVDLFARVAPEHKLRLVELLQAQGHVVAMTGDGVNDAPALKQADVGVAMGVRGTDAAREAADIVLVDDNFASIAAAVEEGRRCYENLMKLLIFLVPTSIGQGLIILVGVLFFPIVGGVPLMPIIPLQILWVNFVTGATLALPLAWEAADPDSMRRRPRVRNAPLFNRDLTQRCFLVGILMAAGGAGLFLWEYGEIRPIQETDLALRKAQTMAVTTVVLFQVFYLFQCRGLRTSLFELRGRPNLAVYWGTMATVVMQVAFVHSATMNRLFHSAPLDLADWVRLALVAALVVPVVALHKHRARMNTQTELADWASR